MAYIYRHIRLDKNEPFYIGIGKYDDNYYRAKTIRNRNKIWNLIINKTAYDIEIMIENLTWKEACDKEIEFIKLYGRIDLNTGCLCNLTEGGDGRNGYIQSEETRRKIGEKSKGRIKSAEQIEKWRKSVTFNRPPELRERIRKTLTGVKHTAERIENIRKSHIGKKLSEETKLKLSKSLKGKKKPKFTEAHLQNMRLCKIGCRQSEETKAKRKETWRLKRQFSENH